MDRVCCKNRESGRVRRERKRKIWTIALPAKSATESCPKAIPNCTNPKSNVRNVTTVGKRYRERVSSFGSKFAWFVSRWQSLCIVPFRECSKSYVFELVSNRVAIKYFENVKWIAPYNRSCRFSSWLSFFKSSTERGKHAYKNVNKLALQAEENARPKRVLYATQSIQLC